MQKAVQQMKQLAEGGAGAGEVLRHALQHLVRLAGARSASLILHRRQARELEFVAAVGEQSPRSPEAGRFPEGRGVAGEVIRSGRSALVNDPASDARFFDVVDRISGFVTHNLLAIPLVYDGHVAGVLCAINKESGFDETDRDTCLALVGALELLLRQVDDADLMFSG
ncbi:MAG: GAF domain-containing protein [Pseudomonadota bacterium]